MHIPESPARSTVLLFKCPCAGTYSISDVTIHMWFKPESGRNGGPGGLDVELHRVRDGEITVERVMQLNCLKRQVGLLESEEPYQCELLEGDHICFAVNNGNYNQHFGTGFCHGSTRVTWEIGLK